MGAIVVTDDTFEKEVLQSTVPVLVDFWAVWCGPCQMQGPIIEDVATTIGDKAKVMKMDVDAQPNYPQQLGVMSIPTLMIFVGGKPVKQFVGVQSKETLIGELNKVIK